jgi:hypothetical protein
LLWNVSESRLDKLGSIELLRKSRIASFHAASSNIEEEEDVQQLAESLKWRLNQWDERQRFAHKAIMKRAHDQLLIRSPDMKKAIEMYEEK